MTSDGQICVKRIKERMSGMLTGRATRSAERAILSMFSWGRNKRGVPSGPKYACLGINICSVDA